MLMKMREMTSETSECTNRFTHRRVSLNINSLGTDGPPGHQPIFSNALILRAAAVRCFWRQALYYTRRPIIFRAVGYVDHTQHYTGKEDYHMLLSYRFH